jgi:hypothetical protein
MKQIVAAFIFAVVLTPALAAQETKPIRYTWIATSCANWNCAAAAMILANGDKHLIVLPTGHDVRPWLILRRVEEGAIELPEGEPFTCSVHDTVVDATNVFTAMDGCLNPMILNTPDGRAVVAGLHKCDDAAQKRRAMR